MTIKRRQPLTDAIQRGLDAKATSTVVSHAIDRAQNTVYYAVIVTDAALGPDATARAEILRKLASLSQLKQIFVFLVNVSDEVSVDAVRVLRTDEAVKSRVQQLGLYPKHIMALVAGWDDPMFEDVLQAFYEEDAPSAAGTLFTVVKSPLRRPAQEEDEVMLFPVATAEGQLTYAPAIAEILSVAMFAPRLNIKHDAAAIRTGAIRRDMLPLENRAREHLTAAISSLGKHDPILDGPASSPLDPRSGAVFLWPRDWLKLEDDPQRDGLAEKLYQYFNASHPDYWEEDRPCKRRILYTPTKILLRGEQYYTNMRRISPFVRLTSMWQELSDAAPVKSAVTTLKADLFATDTHWKLVLGFIDQIRHIALVTFAYVHASATFEPAPDAPVNRNALTACQAVIRKTWGDETNDVHGFLRFAIDAYYFCIFHKADETKSALAAAFNAWDSCKGPLDTATKELKKLTERLPIGDFVRQWREADHPGENILVALQALDTTRAESVDAVGIGWGGIELPLVYDFLARQFYGDKPRRTLHIAQWSHYRSPDRPPIWYHFPVHLQIDNTIDIADRHVILFDDNTLTGITLQRIRDELLLNGATGVEMFLTRYSDERRWGHMQMPDHGVMDPVILDERVGGYLGPTPFARGWSKKAKDYRSAIGVFSMARRRILECIYNNSTVELYDREGF